MSLLRLMGDMAKGAAAGVVLVTALPIAGAVGTITAVGVTYASVIGAGVVAIDYLNDK